MSTPSRDSFGLGQSQTPTYKSNADLFDEYFKYTRDADPTSLYHPVQDQWEMDTLSDDFLEFVTFAEKARKETPDFNELIKRIETEPWGPLKKEKPSPAEHGKKLFREMRERGMMKRSIGVGGATDFDRYMTQRGIRRAGKHFLHSGLPVLAGMLEKTRAGGLGGKLITKGVRAAEEATRIDEPVSMTERIGDQVVGLAGLIKGVPGAVGGMVSGATGAITNPYFLKIGKALLGQKAGHIVGKTVGGAFEHGINLGTALAAQSEEFSAKEMASNFWEGNKMGWLFFGGSFIGPGGKAVSATGEQGKGLLHAVFKKSAPFLTHIARQGFNRAVGSQMAVYDPGILDKIKEGKWEEIDGQAIFDELLFSWFSRKPIDKNRFFLDLSKINAEMAELTPKGLRLKPWNPYYESPEMQERMAQVPASFTGRARGAPEFTQKQLTAGPRAEGKPEGKWSVDTSVDRNVGVFNYRGRRIMISETAPQGEGGSLWYVISDPATKVPKMGTAAPDYTMETKDRLLRKIVSDIDVEQGPEPGSVGEFPLVGPDSRYNEEFFEIPGQVRMEPQRGVTGIPTRIAGGVVPDFFVLPSGEVFPVALFEQTSSPGELRAMIDKAYSLQSTTIAPERMLPGKVSAELPGPPVAPAVAPPVVPAVEPKAVEFMPHAGEAVSAEALSRQKTIRFFAYDTATKKIRPMIGVDAIDAPIKPREIRLQQNLNTGKVEALDRGSKAMGPDLDLILKRPDVKEAIAIKEPVPPKVKSIRELAEELGHDIDQPPPPTEKSIRQIAEQLGFDLDEVMRESSKRATEEAKKITADKLDYYSSGLNLFKALESWGDHLYSKYADPKTAPPELKKELKINAAMAANVTREERTFKIGRRVLTNLYSMGKGGEKIGDASIKFIKGRSQAEQYDLFRLMSAFDVMAREIPRAQKMRKPFKTADVVASKMFDMMEGKVQPKTAGEKTAYKVLDTLRTEVAAEAERVGLKVSTLGGEAKEWAPRKDYAPVEYTNLRRFLESKSFKHLRDMYIDELAKRLDPELYKADKERAILIAEDNFLSLKADMRSRKFGHLERERVLDESLLEKIRKRWEVAHPGEKFPLERKRTLDVWVRYFTGARERLAWIDAFGKDLYVKGVGYVPSKLRDMRLDLSEPNYRYVESIFSRYLKQGAPLDSRLTRYLRGIRTYQLTKLAFAFIPNSLQWFTNTIPQIDLKTAFEVIPDLAKYAGLNGKEIKARQREWFSKTGAQTYKHAFSMTMLDNPEKLSKFADIMLKVHGFSGTESFNAIFAAHAGARHQIAISKKLYEASKKQSGIKWYRRPFYASELKKYGLKAEDIEAISKDGPLTFEKNMQATLDAGFHMRRTTQFLADMFHLPSSWSTPFGRLLTQFKNFSYNQSALVIDSARQLGKWANPKAKGGIFSEGSPMPFIKMMPALTIAGALIHAFKKETYPAIGMHFYEELTAGKSWPYMVGMYLANSGGLGMLMDITNAAQFGGASMLEMVGGPTASDFMQLADSIGKTHDELTTAWEYKYPGWIVKRRHRLASHWLKMLEAMSPDARLVVQNWFPNYKKTKTFANWSNVVTDAYDRYRMLYKTKSPERADEFWGFFMETQGAEYEEVTGKQPRKPTAKEVEKWWVDRDKAPADAMSVPGITPKKNKTLGQYEFWR